MTDDLTLIKSNPLLPVEDFSFLKREGISQIEKLSGDIWTEYNTSDPGITILEAVSYAITDLAYRTSFDMKDLLTPAATSKDMWNKIFYTARQILHCNPVTISDWRKVIIDTEGVRNAWLEPSKDYEVPIYVEYDWVQAKKNCEGEPCFGVLSIDPNFKKNLPKDSPDRGFEAAIKEFETNISAKIKAITDTRKSNLTGDAKTKFDEDKKKLDDEWKNIFELRKAKDYKGNIKETIIKHIEKYYPLYLIEGKTPGEVKMQISELIDFVKNEISVVLAYFTLDKDTNKILELEGLFNVIIEYEEDYIEDLQREEVREKVVEKLHRRRNLCEDFLSVNAVDYDDFTADGLIILKENADTDEVLAQIAFTIYRYFTPRVGFYTIDQMMNKGYTVEEIFEGPALKHGFIDTAELENTDLFRDLRLSDLVNLIADIEGIEAITNFYIPKKAIDDNDKDVSIYFNRWLEKLKDERKMARFDLKNSKFTFLKKNSVTNYNSENSAGRRIDRPARRFEDLKAQDQAYKLQGQQTDFPILAGENMALEDYYPIQYSLPNVYGVGEHEQLPKNPKDSRTIQAYQLKGYLQFFEQILSNYHAQLNHLNDIFSFDENVNQTYYVHQLTEINNLKDIILDYDPLVGESDEHIFSEFSKIIQHLIEPSKLYHQRRNTFLNHLLGCFDEDFSEYEALTRYVWNSETDKKLIADKIRFLQDYLKISSQRGKGFNYHSAEQIWDTENISGAERRIGRLLGFKNINRHSLAPSNLVKVPVMMKNNKGDLIQKPNAKGEPLFVIHLLNEKKEILLISNEIKDSNCCIDEFMNLILQQAESRKNFETHDRIKGIQRSKQKEQIGTFTFDLLDKEGSKIAHSEEYSSKNCRNDVIDEIIEITNCINDNEGMHLVEHILLRPKLDAVLPYADLDTTDNQDVMPEKVKLFKICLDPCDLNKGVDEVVEEHIYRVKVSRIPAEKCYNNEPWVLEIFDDSKPKNNSILYQKMILDKDGKEVKPSFMLTFRKYEAMNKRLADLREFGSEPDNYDLVIFTEFEKPDAAGKENSKFSFKILNEKNEVLAQTRFHEIYEDAKNERDALVKYFSYQLDLYCEENICDHNEDPYSFRVTIVLPCWVKRFRNEDYRYFVEKTIQSEIPAHIDARIKWVGIHQMQVFEKAYCAWLDEFTSNPYPQYLPVNELVQILDNLTECGHCQDDCRPEASSAPTHGGGV